MLRRVRVSFVGLSAGDVGTPRLAEIVEGMTGNAVAIRNRRFDGFVDQGIVVLAADSGDARIDLSRGSQRSPSRLVHRQDSTSTTV